MNSLTRHLHIKGDDDLGDNIHTTHLRGVRPFGDSARQERGSLSWRSWVIIGYLLAALVLIAAWTWSVFGPLDQAALADQRSNLTSIAHTDALALQVLEQADPTMDASALIEKLSTDSTIRITVISQSGEVLADSVDDPTTMENHSTRPEVIAALAGEVGSDTRVSVTEGVERLYIAVPVSYQGESCVLRVSSLASNIAEMTQGLRVTSLVLLTIGLFIAASVALFTIRRAAHPVRHLEQVRTDFVANASHELKTPVAGILLLSEAIQTACDDGDIATVRSFATRLNAESARLQHIVLDLLDLSRIERGSETSPSGTTTDFHSAVSTSLEVHRGEATDKGLSLTLSDSISANDSCLITLSATDASLIVDNLLENSIRYTERGSVTVLLDADETTITLAVADTGIGIPFADQGRIFERFYRVDTAHSRELGGTGLGLSLVRHAVQRGSGTIELASIPGEGSTFTVRIPRAEKKGNRRGFRVRRPRS
jgi:two-component system phosphate regulon sensor histidine kinase PhoR